MKKVTNKLGGVFIPVKNIIEARDWYCDLLGFSKQGEIYFGHLFVIPLEGANIVLDSKVYAPENIYNVPAFQFHVEDIQEAYQHLKQKNVQLTTKIENSHWFNFNDPDGNILMMCM